MHPQILYEDNHIIIVNKRPSEIVQGDKSGDEPLSERVKQYIKEKYNKPGDVFLGVVHRLDRPVSGIVIFARTSKALTRLNEMLREKQIKKTYWAVTANLPREESEHLIDYLVRDSVKNKSFITKENKKGAKRAELIYTHIKGSDKYHLLEVELLTGRHHQIRVQLAHMGCPVRGDVKYGAQRTNKDASIHLHARKIEFIHPVKKEPIQLEANPPDDPLWNYFSE
ncbi:MAG: RNA pseudouridine synthase [Chlorobi bacterium]|nr:RNA pseudouridine synthase [Chlorobiota bacterium]